MRQLFLDMRARCEVFLAAPDDLALITRAGPAEYAALVSTLDGIEKGGSPHMFWLFVEPFLDPGSYAEALARNFLARFEALQEELEKAGEPALPAPPELLRARGGEPLTRLRALMTFARDLLPDLDEQRAVFGFLPSELQDPEAFATMVIALLRHELPTPWCHHMRVVVRELADRAVLHTRARALPRAQWYEPDLSPPKVEQALADEAADETLPIPQRMQALFILAGMDQAQRRNAEAEEKLELLTSYYGGAGDKPLFALCLNARGELAERAGDTVLARDLYERALTPAVEAESLPPLINITLNLANLHRNEKRYKDAAEHYEAVSALAGACANATLRIRSLEQIGFCKHQLGDTKGAFESFDAGRTLARGVEAESELLGCLHRLQSLFAELGMGDEKRETEREIAELEARGVEVYPA